MANSELNVILSAEGKQLASTLQKAEKDVQSLEKELNNLKPSFDQVDKSVNKTASSLKSAASSTNQFVKGVKLSDDALKKIPTSSNASAQSLLNLGRVAQDAPFGILGIANNINPLLESFQRLQKETGSTGGALKSLVSGLTGAGGLGLAVSVVSSLLIVFGDKLFGAREASKASEEALRSLSDALEGVKDNVKLLSDELQFANQLGGINVKIRGGGEIQDLLEQSVAQAQNTVLLKDEAEKLRKIGDDIANNTELSAKDRIDAEQKYFDQLKSINADIRKSEQDQTIIYRRIALQRIEDQKKANEEAKRLSDKAFDDLIKRAKLAEKFINERTIRFANFEIDPTESRQETIDKAQKFIQDVFGDIQKGISSNRRVFLIKTVALIDGIDLKPTQNYFENQKVNALKIFQDLQDEITKLTKRNPILIQARTATETEKARGAEFFSALGIASADENAPKSLLTDSQKAAVNLATVMNQTVVPAFDNLFNAIKAGESPIRAFFQGLGQAIQQLMQKLLQAVLQAALLSAITGGATSFKGAFKSLLGFRAEGGPVFAGKPYIVGEKGPELFVPQRGGQIVPNNEMNAGLSGITAGSMHITVDGRLRNRDIVLGASREAQFGNRNY